MNVLLLNHACKPINLLSVGDAIKKVHQGKVEVLSVYDKTLTSIDGYHEIPAVIKLKQPIKLKKKFITQSGFSRLGIFIRDEGECQYCGKQLTLRDFTIDHVVPKSHGGELDWMNIVACCKDCNGSKKNRTPQQAGMSLRRNPFKPGIHVSVAEKNRIKLKAIIEMIEHDEWKYYIDWKIKE